MDRITPTGLPNIGNSCYFNAFIQICKPLAYEVLTKNLLAPLVEEVDDDADDTAKKRTENNKSMNRLLTVFRTFYEDYFQGGQLSKSYRDFYLTVNAIRKFTLGSQQDSSEGITLVTDLIKSNQSAKHNVTVAFNQVIECANCHTYKICDVQEEAMLFSNSLNMSVQVLTSFKEFLGNTLIRNNFEPTDPNIFTCHCPNKKLTIRMVLTQLPKYLYINVGRYSNNGNKLTKRLEVANNFSVQVPCNLEDVVSKKNNAKIEHDYDLFGIVIHHGGSLHSGHYVAYIRDNVHSETWHYCDDSRITTMNNFNLQSSDIQANCTVLLYVRR
jgi:ubiquitin carboxyl-terminal hydrolase 36/42